MGWGNPILGGIKLIRSAIQSPNFKTGVQGWSINQDGSAEFHSTVIGGQLIGDGIGNEVLIYTGTPAHGNLIASVSSQTDTDLETNRVLDGVTSYGPNGGMAQLAANQTTGEPFLVLYPNDSQHIVQPPQVYGSRENPGAVNELEELVLHSGTTSSGGFADIILVSENNNATTIPIIAFNIGGITVLIADAAGITVGSTLHASVPGSPGTQENWNTITLDSGWSTAAPYQVPQYRLLPDGNLQLRGRASAAAWSGGKALNLATPLGTGYQPQFPCDFVMSDSIGFRAHCSIGTNGVISANIPSGSTGTWFAEINGSVPLN